MTAKITLLGTGTCQIQSERMASSVLLEIGEQRVVFDMGRGVTQRLLEYGLKSDDVRNIVFSHFHPDHISDLIPFLHAAAHSRIDPRKQDLHLYGPKGVRVQIMRLLSLFGVDELERDYYDVLIHEIRSESFSINRLQFDFLSLPPANNHGLRFEINGKRIALTGDSHFHDELVKFIAGAELAVIDSGHLSDDEILSAAARSQAKTIVCSHLYRELDEQTLSMAAKSRGYAGKLIVGRDLMSFNIG
ncbi:MAG: ribonuclease Z [Deltaproteobacteria bacterium]|nr:ribonuclease Z [Deltaproteobacteria bacterium]